MISRDVEFDEEGVWDFGSNNDTTSIPPFGDPRIDEQIREEQQEQTTPPASPATSVGGSLPSFLNERATQRAQSLDEVYEDTEMINKYLEDNGFTKCPHEHALYVKRKGNDILIVCLYVDDLIFTGNNPSMFEEFKKAMTEEFKMTDIGLMAYYLGVEVKQLEDRVFITQEHYAKEILKKFKMEDCKPINTPVDCGVKLSKNDKGEKMSKKQLIVTLSTCEAKYVAATFSVCHAIWLRSLLAELGWSQKEPTTICVDNKSAIALSKNPVFHNRSKHIDTHFHYIREYVANQKI
ncbi:hypothetical protein SASPL_146975 [Salvia splendens]|uniref:Reverse transcriptase Ty1/copia-type domain-containing protein n=1 Tax=Salvia splendens TaxID=180675 RepID=A0A8X8WDR7_SALSN|nr:hypothetical protein SASPL_146975 [Salvia splendens]